MSSQGKRTNGCIFSDCITEPCIKKHPMKSKDSFCTGYSDGKKRNRIRVGGKET